MEEILEYVTIKYKCYNCKDDTEIFLSLYGTIDYRTCNTCNKETYFYFDEKKQLHQCDRDPRESRVTKPLNHELLDADFLQAMEKCFAAGNKNGRKPNDWKDREYTKNLHDVYLSKIMRHAASSYSGTFTGETKREHLAAVACNANILWHMLGDK
jgi:hypothetical protein